MAQVKEGAQQAFVCPWVLTVQELERPRYVVRRGDGGTGTGGGLVDVRGAGTMKRRLSESEANGFPRRRG